MTRDRPLVSLALTPQRIQMPANSSSDQALSSFDRACAAADLSWFLFEDGALRLAGTERERPTEARLDADDRARLEKAVARGERIALQARIERDGPARRYALRGRGAGPGRAFGIAVELDEGENGAAAGGEEIAELRRANAELERFVAIASHDLAAPLRAVDRLTAELEGELDADRAEALALARESLDRMRLLLDELRAYAVSGWRESAWEVVDLDGLIDDAFALSALDASRGGRRFVLERALEVRTARLERAPFATALRNLIANAIRHHDRADGRLRIAARLSGDRLECAVRDDGPGAPDAAGDGVASSSRGRRGLGLELARRLIRRRGGALLFERAPGERGLVARFDWPARPS